MRQAPERFDGWIGGLGTAAGLRLVVGHWPDSPLGAFTDVMLERPDGHRVLLAPSQEVADFVASTYTFDEVRLVPVEMQVKNETAELHAGDLTATIRLGRRTPLGWLLRAVPPGWPPRRAGSPPSTPSPGGSCPASGPSAAPATTGPSTTAPATCTASPTPPSMSTAPIRAR